MKRVLPAAIAAILLLGACGDDGDSDDAGNASVERVKASLVEDGDFALSDDEAQCIAEGVVGALGEERVDQIDWSDGDVTFEAAEAEGVADSFDGCLELNAFFAESFSEEEGLSDDARECLAGEVSSDEVKAFLVVGFSGDTAGFEDAFTPIDEALQSCLTEEEYAAL